MFTRKMDPIFHVLGRRALCPSHQCWSRRRSPHRQYIQTGTPAKTERTFARRQKDLGRKDRRRAWFSISTEEKELNCTQKLTPKQTLSSKNKSTEGLSALATEARYSRGVQRLMQTRKHTPCATLDFSVCASPIKQFEDLWHCRTAFFSPLTHPCVICAPAIVTQHINNIAAFYFLFFFERNIKASTSPLEVVLNITVWR